MRILIKRAVIVDQNSGHHGKKRDILIHGGKIREIGRGLTDSSAQVIEKKNLHVSPGWCDLGSQVNEPGLEYRESFQTLARAAVAGGFTAVATFPNTDPAVHSKSEVEYVRNRSQSLPVNIYPIGAITRDCCGTEIAEMHDMHSAGAVAFSDGRNALEHSGLMQIAQQYVLAFNGLIVNRPFDSRLAPAGQIHEGSTCASLGLKGIPVMAETVMLQRDLRLLHYTGSRLHVFGISSAESVAEIRRVGKIEGLTCSTTALNLLLSDKSLESFNTNLKVIPPLRDESDRKALIRGVANGLINCIVSNHEPYEKESKDLEFANAQFGSTGLQSAFAIANHALKDVVPLEGIISCLSHNPRMILGLPANNIENGVSADLTLFNPEKEVTFGLKDLKSKSRNSAIIDMKLTGKVYGIVCKGRFHHS